jgi:GLPGLI family protein
MKKIFLTVVAFAGMFAAQAQIKEGVVTYSVAVEGLPPEQASMMKGMELTMTFKDKKSRAEFSSAMMTTITISDDNGSLTLMDGMGQKSYIKMSKADLEKDAKKAAEPKITYTDEKMTIAGYECKKAIIEVKDQKGEMQKVNVWYTEKLPNNSAGRMMGAYKGLKGAPLEFDVSQGPMKMKMTATKVSLSPVTDSQFVVSTDGYTEMKAEDLKKMGAGQGAH